MSRQAFSACRAHARGSLEKEQYFQHPRGLQIALLASFKWKLTSVGGAPGEVTARPGHGGTHPFLESVSP